MLAIALFGLFLVQEPEARVAIQPVETVVAAEDLLPADTYAVVRIASLDRLAQIALPYQRIEDPQAEPLDLLALAMEETPAKVDWSLIDRTQPVLVAVTNSRINHPVAGVIVASSKDAAAFAGDPGWKRSGFTCTAQGAFVVFSTEPLNGGGLARDSVLRRGLDRSDFAVRVDFRQVMAQFGDEVHGLVYGELDKSADEGAPDAEIQMGERLIDAFFSWADSIEALGVSIHAVEERLQLGFELVALPNSVLANVEPVDTRELEKLVRCIDPASPIAFVSAMDPSKMMKGMFSLFDFDTLLASAGEEGEQAKQMLSSAAEMYENIGSLTAAGMRFGKSGMAAAYALRPKDAAKLVDSYRKMFSIEPGTVQVDTLDPVTVAGREVHRLRVKPIPPAQPEATTSETEAERRKAYDGMTKLFGTDALPFCYTLHEGRMLATLGSDAEMEAAIGRSASTSTSPAGRELLSMLGSLNPGWAMRIDVPTLAQSFVDLGSVFDEDMPVHAEQCVAFFQNCRPIDMRFGLDQRTWRLTLDVDGVRLARAFKSIDELETANAPKAKAVRADETPVDEPK